LGRHHRSGWLFADTLRGAIACTNLHSVIEIVKPNGVEPDNHLWLLFERLPH